MVAVNASWGLGLAVVGGETNPDDFLVSKVTGEVVRRTINAKEIEYVVEPGGRGTVQVDVPAERRDAACLDDDRLAEVVAVAKRIERHFGSHQDIEWSIERGTGTLYALQARPVTAERDAPTVSGSAISLVMDAFRRGRPSLMPLSDDDVREILRLIDETEDEELELETRRTPSTSVRWSSRGRPRGRARSPPARRRDRRHDTRDGNQSLWSATGLTTDDIVSIAPTIDRVGFHAMDFSSSTHMAVAVRFHQEDPWERLRLVRAAMPNTPLSYITTGMPSSPGSRATRT